MTTYRVSVTAAIDIDDRFGKETLKLNEVCFVHSNHVKRVRQHANEILEAMEAHLENTAQGKGGTLDETRYSKVEISVLKVIEL